jgi:hypothetical protein
MYDMSILPIVVTEYSKEKIHLLKFLGNLLRVGNWVVRISVFIIYCRLQNRNKKGIEQVN